MNAVVVSRLLNRSVRRAGVAVVWVACPSSHSPNHGTNNKRALIRPVCTVQQDRINILPCADCGHDAYLIPDSSFVIARPMTTMFVVVLSIFIIHWQLWSQTIIVNTTSGRLLGAQANGGVCSLYTFSPCSPELIHRTSGILQGHCKIPTIAGQE